MMAALDTQISDHNVSIESLTPYLHTAPPDETFNYCRTIDEIESKIESLMK